MIIYAAVKGYLDSIKVDSIQQWEALYIDFIKNSYSEILENIVSEKKLLDDNEKKLIDVIKSFNSIHPELSLEIDE